MGEDSNLEYRAEKKKYNKIPVFIGAAVFLATILFIAFFAPGKPKESVADVPANASASPQVSVTSQPPVEISPGNEVPEDPVIDTAGKSVAAPFLYEKNADIFIASGKNKIKLGSRQSLYGCYKEINCTLSHDNRYLYYIEGTDINTGMGILKKVSTDAASSPVTIGDRICAAEVSPDGSIMYIKNLRGIAGDLYLFKDGKSSLISKNVLPLFFRFSKGGTCISYIVQEGTQTFALYVEKSGEESRLVTRIKAEAAIDGGINLSRISDAVPFDTGQVLYSIEENYNTPLYFNNPDGKTERICNDGYIIKTYSGGDFLYADISGNNLWYKSPRRDAVNITGNYSYSRFPEGTNRFLLMEHTGDGFDNSRVMLYEIGEDKKKTTISLGDDRIFEINEAFTCVAYESGGALYASRKTDTGWKEVKLLEASEDEVSPDSKSGVVARFDVQGDNLYFFDEYKCGPLYRYSLKEDKTVKLLINVDSFYINEGAVYAHTTNDRLYRIEGSKIEMVSEGVRNVNETRGGAFLLIANGSFKFIPEGSKSSKLMDGFTGAAALTGSIEFRPPLGEDLGAALEVLSDEANYCLYKLGIYRSKAEESINIHDAIAVAQKLAGREDISETERSILTYLAEGFKAYDESKRSSAKASLQKAMDAYAKYINSAGNEEDR